MVKYTVGMCAYVVADAGDVESGHGRPYLAVIRSVGWVNYSQLKRQSAPLLPALSYCFAVK